MNFFDLLRSLVFSRKTTAVDLDSDGLQQFTSYLINRWISFYGKPQNVFINETLNKFTGLFSDKNELYKLYYYLIPTQSFKKISYVKKKKELEKELNVNIPIIARSQMISQREVSIYLDLAKVINK